jgi:hypothetical protein
MKKLAILLLLVALVLVGLGIPLVSYAPVRSDRYLWGTVDVHSNLSGGRAPLDELARAAAHSGVDFVMLSDHGAPDSETTIGEETVEGVSLIGGFEVALPDGGLFVSDVDTTPHFRLPPYPPDAIADVRKWGGFGIVMEGNESWSYWENDFLPDGLEILNVTSQLGSGSALAKLRWAWFSLFNTHYGLSRLVAPTQTLERWDALLERGPVWGVYATNARGSFPLTERTTAPIFSYESAFSYVALGVKRKYGDDPMKAIRRGDFFVVIRGAGEPERFTFRGGQDARAGSFVPPDTELHVELDAPGLSPRIVLKRDGDTVSETTAGKLDFVADSGVYRVEVYLENHPLLANDVPWILSNPIFAGMSYPPVVAQELTCSEVEPFALGDLLLEMDDESTGSIEIAEDGTLELSYHLSKATPEKPDRWVALALRQPLDLSAYRGVLLEADSSEPMRYGIEVRSGDRSYYGTFGLSKGHNRVAVPWTRFYAMFGRREAPPLGRLDSLFLTVNTSNAYTGFDSKLDVTSFGGCR